MKLSQIMTLAAVIALLGSQYASAQDVVAMPAVQRHMTQTLSAPARVQAASNIVLTASTAGTISGLSVLPGDTVRHGQVIARLTGPAVRAETARLTSEQKSAEIRAATAMQAATIEQQKLEDQLSTRDAAVRAQADRDTARQQLSAAKASARNYESQLSVAAPQAGVVTAVSAADGQMVSTGQALVTVAPSSGLYVVANFYGNDASRVTPGTEGTFLPDGSNGPLQVVVQRTSLSATMPGQMDAWLKPVDGRVLPAGAVGTLSLSATTEKLAVPASALVLDGGQWWVLVHDKRGNQRRHVTPGTSDKGWTAIQQGLAPDERVVTQDAYLLFHQDFAKRYQQAD
ncbi:efflux RND transporter periplasmic adaptor subunit [Paraburkholderia sp. UYCP14C]|uniref:efflux RND transporter periplasmic adaptor subunit n=1 Tax=Paraburkholderia sp. UYCP14C TaxID=2511130 RepID=UPI0010227F72|nr:efflux RND transporter periplasmic adaptor subunit [Paraburkholderia sp. UYCP14C]RZF27942.1 efflux RND transporter periplasmic adaptor subunit [Paraburkholderia sp. UYCP14C]